MYRYLPTGRLDPGFGNGGIVATGFDQLPPTGPGPGGQYPYPTVKGEYPYQTASVRVSGMTVDADDRPVVTGFSVSRVTVCGYATHYLTYLNRSYVARLTSNGDPDPSFGVGGVVTDDYVENPLGPAIQSAGRVAYVTPTGPPCPRFPWERGIPAVMLLRKDGAPGRRVAVLRGHREFQTVNVRAIASDRRGRIVLLAKSVWETGVGLDGMTVRRLLLNGSPDTGFGRRGSTSPKLRQGARLRDLAVDRRGRVLLAGSTPNRGGVGRSFLLIRLSASGKVDHGFGRRGRRITGFGKRSSAEARQLALDGRARIVVGGTVASPRLATGYGLAFARYFPGR